MNKYTVFFTHDMPLGMGVASYHLQYLESETPEAAAERCEGMMGGYATILLVLDGHIKPLVEHKTVWTDEKFEIALHKDREERERKHKEDPTNPAYFPTPRTIKKI